jgi:putative peptidoglycan lipid II flippase
MKPTAVPSSAANSAIARRVALAALLIALGNIASRVLGVVREAVIAGTFGRGADVATFKAASTIPTILYDLLVSGAISAALVPVLSEYSEGDDAEFWHVASTIINLTLLSLAIITALLIWQAPVAVTLLAGGFQAGVREQTIQMVRWLLPAVVFMGLSGLITALLYARQRFLLPAFTTSTFNLGIIVGALLLTPLLGPFSLVAGVLIGALLQVLLQLPGLRNPNSENHSPFYRPILDLRHPGVRRILKLYAPVALGIGFSVIGVVLDRNLASRQAAQAIPTMAYATTLIQFPLGLVATAVSFAVLPTLSRQAAAHDERAFRATLGMGIKVVLLLILPAAAGLAALATPITALIFERRAFSAGDTAETARALLFYLPGLPAAALDQMLLFAFYAHKRTLAPNLVQGAAIGLYAITALALLALTDLGYFALILGNSAQWIGHALILLLISRGLVSLRGLRLGESLINCGGAALALLLVAWGIAAFLPGAPLARLVLAGGAGAAVYFGICLLLRVEALDFFVAAVRQRIDRTRPA